MFTSASPPELSGADLAIAKTHIQVLPAVKCLLRHTSAAALQRPMSPSRLASAQRIFALHCIDSIFTLGSFLPRAKVPANSHSNRTKKQRGHQKRLSTFHQPPHSTISFLYLASPRILLLGFRHHRQPQCVFRHHHILCAGDQHIKA